MGGFSLWHWLIVLVIVVLVFGTKRLKNVGKDLGEAVKGFKQGMHDDDKPGDPERPAARLQDETRPVTPPADPAAARPAASDSDAPSDDDRSPR